MWYPFKVDGKLTSGKVVGADCDNFSAAIAMVRGYLWENVEVISPTGERERRCYACLPLEGSLGARASAKDRRRTGSEQVSRAARFGV